jgi:ABC-2 type transport system ATP-binding protein
VWYNVEVVDIECKNISKKFNDFYALDDISFKISSGEIVGFIGANGAGKTTAMRIIMGVLASTNGQVLFNNHEITLEDRRKIGYMPSERGLYPKKKVGKQLQYLAMLHGLSASKANEQVDKYLELLNIKQYKNKALETLSTGNQQRIQLIVSLIFEPSALILDEPFSGLDPVAVHDMSSMIREQAKKNGVPVLFSSHQLELVDELCDRIILIKNGKILAHGSPEQLREEYGYSQTIEIPTPLASIFYDLISGGTDDPNS